MEEHEIAGLEILDVLDLFSDLELIFDLTRQRRAVARVHPLRKPAAVESAGIASAVAIGRAAEAERRVDERQSRRGHGQWSRRLGRRDGWRCWRRCRS